jgi:hypothetical protein
VAPKGDEDIEAKFAQPLELGAFGQGAKDARGQMLVPSAHTGQLIGTATSKERGKPEAEEFSEQLLLGSQATFNLDDQIIGEAQVIEGLVKGFDVTLDLSLLALVTFLSAQATTIDGFGVFFCASSVWGHGGFLRLV